jgi:hypothetical protein
MVWGTGVGPCPRPDGSLDLLAGGRAQAAAVPSTPPPSHPFSAHQPSPIASSRPITTPHPQKRFHESASTFAELGATIARFAAHGEDGFYHPWLQLLPAVRDRAWAAPPSFVNFPMEYSHLLASRPLVSGNVALGT